MRDDPQTRIAAARSLVGTPFRLQGRSCHGLDCVGLVASVYDLNDAVPDSYAMRGFDPAAAERLLDRHFERRQASRPEPGDVMLLAPGFAQLHLGVWTGDGLVHAHAGLRRVVETPGLPDQRIVGIWCQETD